MNAVIYARYSSHNQTEQSIEGQLQICHEFAQRNGYTIVGEYIDRAISGTTDARPDFLRMIEDSAKKGFQFVIVYQLDRFARNRYDSAIYKSRLKKNGVRVLSARENITDDASGILVEGLLEAMAEYYSAELGQKIRRGMDLNAEKCLCTGGGRALGFKIVDKHFYVDEDTAPIVVKIFEMYASGKSVVEICDTLNAQGYKTSTGAAFNKNSLRKMLQNKRYIGVYTYKGEETPGGMPRIVEDELFFKVQERLEKNRKAPAHTKAKQEYILTTKLFCGYCHEMMTGYGGTGKSGQVHHYYACNGVKHKTGCHKKTVRKLWIEDLVVAECRKQLTPSNIDKIAHEVVALCEREKDSANLKRLDKLIKDNERKQRNLMTAVTECEIETVRKSLYEEMSRLSDEHNALESEYALEQASSVTLTVDEVKFFLTQLRNGRADNLEYRKTLITVFVNAIYLFDDRLTIFFNSGDTPVNIDEALLSEAIEKTGENEGSFLDSSAPPLQSQTNQHGSSGFFMLEDLHGQRYFRAALSGVTPPGGLFRARRNHAAYFPSECAGLCTWERWQELRLIQVSLAIFSAQPCYNVSTQQCVFRRTEQMASTEPSMTEQHTCSAAALPEGAFLPAGPQCPGRHPESGAAGSAGALFCARVLVTQAAAVYKYTQEGC